jgi:hypothetical protein
MSTTVEIDKDALLILVWFARMGDVANSGRRLRTGFRKHAVCSGDEREADCPSCDAFTKAEAATGLKTHVV